MLLNAQAQTQRKKKSHFCHNISVLRNNIPQRNLIPSIYVSHKRKTLFLILLYFISVLWSARRKKQKQWLYFKHFKVILKNTISLTQFFRNWRISWYIPNLCKAIIICSSSHYHSLRVEGKRPQKSVKSQSQNIFHYPYFMLLQNLVIQGT